MTSREEILSAILESPNPKYLKYITQGAIVELLLDIRDLLRKDNFETKEEG